jgi:tRNA pseudouridine55 synthase
MTLCPGFIVVDKAPGITSHDVVAMVRAVTGIEKVGHTGTLDPFATGVLPLALGAATRLIQYLDESEKVYDATIALGTATDTGDPTGKVVREAPLPQTISPERLRDVLETFKGERMQRPPRYSAVKIAGRRLYQYARAGQDVEAEPRPIRIFGIDLLDFGPDSLRVLIRCSRGTYARVLADEIAQALGTAGHLARLSRVRSGPFTIDRAIRLEQISETVTGTTDWVRALQPSRGVERVQWRPREVVAKSLSSWLIRPAEALSHLEGLQVSTGVAAALGRGGKAPPPPIGLRPGSNFLLLCGGDVAALATSRGGGQSHVLWRAAETNGGPS